MKKYLCRIKDARVVFIENIKEARVVFIENNWDRMAEVAETLPAEYYEYELDYGAAIDTNEFGAPVYGKPKNKRVPRNYEGPDDDPEPLINASNEYFTTDSYDDMLGARYIIEKVLTMEGFFQ